MDTIDEIMTAGEVAAYLKLPETAIHKLAAKGALPAVDINGDWRFKKSALDKFLADQLKSPRTTELAEQAASSHQKSFLLTDCMREDSVAMRLAATSRDGVLRDLVGLTPIASEHFRRTLFEALKAREDLCSTGVGEGVAIPHARNAMVGLVSKPVIAFGRHQKGIEFGALDGKPVHLFFLLCAPNVRLHLQLLAKLSRVLHQQMVRDALMKATRPTEALRIIRLAESL
jgi:PTS system nitrogen regulatory IIA component